VGIIPSLRGNKNVTCFHKPYGDLILIKSDAMIGWRIFIKGKRRQRQRQRKAENQTRVEEVEG